MRNKLIAIIILLIAFSLISIGLIQSQQLLINSIYDQMVGIP
jgi:hypothetical protein